MEAMKTHPGSSQALKLLLEEKLLSGLCSQETHSEASPGQGCPDTSSAVHRRIRGADCRAVFDPELANILL